MKISKKALELKDHAINNYKDTEIKAAFDLLTKLLKLKRVAQCKFFPVTEEANKFSREVGGKYIHATDKGFVVVWYE